MKDAIGELADTAGILPGYRDLSGQWRETPRETKLALLGAMDMVVENVSQARDILDELNNSARNNSLGSWRVVVANEIPNIEIGPSTQFRLEFEDGTKIEGEGPQEIPPLPLGRHQLVIEGRVTTLLSAPRALPIPPRGWGVVTPLAGLQNAKQGGIGDYQNLETASIALCRHGADFIGINPVHAGFPEDHLEISPYAPSHRRRLNALHVAISDDEMSLPRHSELIDFATLIPDKWAGLRKKFDSFELNANKSRFEKFLADEGAALELFALHQALSAVHGPYWKDWPESLHDPHSQQTMQSRQELASETRFHCWLQWKAELQLAGVRDALNNSDMSYGLYLDIAVGTHPWGAETWMENDQFATGASLGAPPDAFSSEGQNWGLAPFNPHALAKDGFRALAETLRKQLQFAGLLRIDHILGFERAFWVPSQPGLVGAYVKMPREAMLAVVRIEAARANATVIGEDLGNIPDGLQEELAKSGIMGCRVMMFENRVSKGGEFVEPDKYPEQTLASFSTHDLPTWLGWRRCTDINVRLKLGNIDKQTAEQAVNARKAEIAAFDRLTGTDAENPDAMHTLLGKTNSKLVALQIEDILQVEAQPNLPGTIHEYPNWRQRLPIGANEFADEPRIAHAAQIMKESGR